MRIGVRQRLILLVLVGIFVTMSITGSYRYFREKRSILNSTRAQAGQSVKLISELSVPFLLASDYSGLYEMAENFMHLPDVQEITITDNDGRQLIQKKKPLPVENPVVAGSSEISSQGMKLGEVSLSMYPDDMSERLRSYAVNTLFEHLLLFFILSGILYLSVSRIVTSPVKALADTLKKVIDRKDFTQRAAADSGGEIGFLGQGVNYLLESLERVIIKMDAISSHISDLGPTLAATTREIRKNAEVAAETIASVSSSVAEMNASIQAVGGSAESLSSSAEQTSASILEMNASNQEVARRTTDLASAVEDVTTSVAEMIASIKEVAGHVDELASSAEQTSASATQLDATVREVERSTSESARLSLQVSTDAKDVGVKSITETIAAMSKIKDAVERYSSLVTRLGKRSEEIGKILAVIAEITEQTNLLALNASILAAQAGEQGKGFSVVAGEIKALAERTAASTQDIAKLIAAVRKESKDAVTAMSEGLSAVTEGVSRSQNARAALDKVLASSERSAETAALIKKAMAEQSAGIRQVSQASSNVKQMANQIAAATQAQSKGAEMILRAAEDMRDIARRVKTAMVEQSEGGRQIAAAAENVTRQAGQIASASKAQQQGSSRILDAIGRIHEPRENVKRMEEMTNLLKSLTEQAALLKQELSAMTVRKGIGDTAAGSLKLGVIPLESPAEMHRRFTPIAEYLANVLGRPVELLLSVDFEHTIADFGEGTTNVAFLTPSTYIEAKKKFDARLLVKALRKGVPYNHSVIAVSEKSGMTRVEDLRGRRMAFGDMRSTSSYLMPRAMLLDAGIVLEDLKGHSFLGHHDDVAKAVLSGECDAGGLMEATARKFESQGLRIIKISKEIPEFNICASNKLDGGLIGSLKSALMSLSMNDRGQAAVLTAIDPEYTGFAEAVDADYDIIREIMGKMQ